MAFENLFIRTEKSVGGIRLDAVLSESHDNEVSLTSNPVELGADITDHAIIEPKKITIVAEVTDTPLSTAEFGEIVDSESGLFGKSTENSVTRSGAAYNSLVQLQETRQLIEVQTRLRLYKNMIITSIKTEQDKDTSRMVRLVMSLQEVIITESEIVQLSEDQLAKGATREQAASAEKRGRKEPTTVPDGKKSSVLKSIIDWVNG